METTQIQQNTYIQKMKFLYTTEDIQLLENEDIMNFGGKWIELENTILSEVTQIQNNMHGLY